MPADAQPVRRSDIDVGKQLRCRSHATDDPQCIFTVGASRLKKSFGVDRVAVMTHVAMRFAEVFGIVVSVHAVAVVMVASSGGRLG